MGLDVYRAYFGEAWPSSICEDARQAATPVGDLCAWCDEAIVEGDRGHWIGGVTREGSVVQPWHRECSFRSVMGGIGHFLGRCKCHGNGTENLTDLPELSLRQNALLVWAWVQAYGHPT